MRQTKNLAVIPARSGSKGLKDKNIKMLLGKPLMAYTIEAAINSGVFEEVYVSTDSVQYSEIAKEYGAKVPFLRSRINATDTASSWDTVLEALDRYEEFGREFQTVMLLQPTSPLRNERDIVEAYDVFIHNKANAVVSVCEADHSPLWCNTLPKDYSMEKFIDYKALNVPRQKLDTYYRINGAIYVVDIAYLKNDNNIYRSKCFAHIMDKRHSIDIDDEFDFKYAEILMKASNNNIYN